MRPSLTVVGQKNKKKKLSHLKIQNVQNNEFHLPSGERIDTEHMLLSYFLPPAVKAFYEQLNKEVKILCGDRYKHTENSCSRWGKQNGSIVLGNQKIAIERPRVRDVQTKKEVQIPFYEKFQSNEIFDKNVFESGIKKVSQRDYKNGLPAIAESFGMSKSQVSRSWIKTTAKSLDAFMNRSFKDVDLVAVFLDGKRFKSIGCLIAMGVDSAGKKHMLGIYQCSSEHSENCKSLLDDLENRGLKGENLLFVVDGGSGLNKALREKYETDNPETCKAIKVRCYVHKWENIKSALDQHQQIEAKALYWAIRDAKDLSQGKVCAEALKSYLKRTNASALGSFVEAEEDLLNVHKLKLGTQLKKFFTTTNPIENLNSLLEEDTRRVKRWKDSTHFRRWIATMVMKNEKRMRRVKGFTGMEALKVQIQNHCTHEILDENLAVA
jgi:transposase-like protein